MLLVDDLLYTLTIQPFIKLLEIIRNQALLEKYQPQKIKDKFKENRMLYEMDKISEEKYKKREEELKAKLQTAKRVKESEINNNYRKLR